MPNFEWSRFVLDVFEGKKKNDFDEEVDFVTRWWVFDIIEDVLNETGQVMELV